MKSHPYETRLRWTSAEGTTSYRSYSRDFTTGAADKPPIEGSSDPAFRGNPARYNPEELLVASLSSCHMLWYLHLCAINGVVVFDYADAAIGTLEEQADGLGRFVSVELRPVVSISAESDAAKAAALHDEAHRLCFIARSVNFPVAVQPALSPASRS